MEILIIVLLIACNGVFSMSEIAMVSVKKFRLEHDAKRGSANAKQALALATNPNIFLSTVQIGITLIGILTGVFSGKQLTVDLAVYIRQLDPLAAYADSIATAVVVLIITYLTIVFGELIPKRLGLNFSEKISLYVSRPMALLSLIARPLIWLLSKTSDLFFRIFGIVENTEGIVTEEEIKEIIQESAEGGEIRKIEEDIVKRVFALGDRKASELMTHRRDLIWIDISDNLNEVKEKLKRSNHSVYPVCDRTIDRLLGLISAKEFYWANEGDKLPHVSGILQKPIFVPENMGAYRVLEHFKSNKLYAALVVDEYGDIQGMITMHDVMEELVGDAGMEEEAYQVFKRDDNSWLVDGQFPYFEFLSYLKLPEQKESLPFTTVAGLFIHLINHIPKTGDKIRWKDYELEIVDMDGQRIDKLLVRKMA